jgi:N-methylhydantoinase B
MTEARTKHPEELRTSRGDDAFVQKILWDRLITIADETVNSLIRTSFSMNVRDSYDLSCVIFDEKGRSVAQGTFSLPTFTGTAPQTLRAILDRFPVGTFEDGDVFVTNDPWFGTGHLYDINICRPIFERGRLLGYAMSITHLPDIGGAGMSSITREVYEEGLIVPPQKIVAGGRINEGLIEIIRANVRVSDQVIGDIEANLSCTEVGARSVREFCEEYGLGTLSEVADPIIARTSAALEQGLLAMPDGRFTNEIRIEDVSDDVTLKVLIEKIGKSIVVDFAGCSPQRRTALNVPFCYTRAVAYYTLKCIFASDLPNNEGTFSPITVRAPEGCILNVRRPVATGARHTIGHYVFPLIMGALKDLAPDRVVTEMGMMNVFNVYGRHMDGAPIASLYFLAGGFGALQGHDGRAAVPGPGNMTALSTEVWEDQTSTTIKYRRILPDSGGDGEFPGGPGQEIAIENTSGYDLDASFLGLRTRIAAMGMAGGGAGALRRFLIDGKVVDGKGRHVIAPGSVLRIEEAGAGGMGDRRRRSAEMVARDIERGYLTREHAIATYPSYAASVGAE